MSRGFVELHGMDVSLKFQFVDRAGRYVYVAKMATPPNQTIGTMRIDMDKSTVMADLAPSISENLRRRQEEANDVPLQLELDLQGGGSE